MPKNQQIGIPLGRNLDVGSTVSLNVVFRGKMSETLNGLYISRSGNRSVLISQFEATYARSAVPCLDEPQFKAKFTVRLQGIEPGLTALSNMPVAERIVNAETGMVDYAYEESVPMSTYLVAIAIGQFESIWATYISPLDETRLVNVSIWAPPGNGASLDFALQAARKSLAEYESTFRVPFPLPEMKMLAAEEFAAGAMENWGLVTYRLTALLADLNSQASMERVAVVVAHELSHQWTGNLVTTAWWGQLFLNEGFASLLEYLGTNASHPEFHVWDEFLANDAHVAMRTDDLSAVSPLVNNDVDSSGAIESQFNNIAYQKGGSVLRMLWKFMDSSPLTQSPDDDSTTSSGSVFFDALHFYLDTYKYSVATSAQMVGAMADYSNYEALNGRMSTWTTQPGVPLVVFAWSDGNQTDPTKTSGNLCISQLRIFRSPYSKTKAASAPGGNDQIYWIPLNMVVPNGTGSPAAQVAAKAIEEGGFDGRDYECFSHDTAVSGYIKANTNSYGYYRVAYPASVWALLRNAVDESVQTDGDDAAFGPQDRAGLLDDLLTVAETAADAVAAPAPPIGLRSGAVVASRAATSMATALDYMSTLRREPDYAVWSSALSHIARISAALEAETPPPSLAPASAALAPDSACKTNFLTYARFIMTPVVAAIGNNTWGSLSASEQPSSETITDLSPEAANIVRALMRRTGDSDLASLRSNVDVAVRNAAIIGTAAGIGFPAVVARAIELWQAGYENVDPNFLAVVARTFVSSGGAAEWGQVKAAYEQTTVAYSKSILLRSLASSRDLTVLNQTLYYAMYDARVSQQDKDTLIAGVASNPVGRALAWGFITKPEVWAQLVEWYGSGGFGWSRLILSMGSNFASQAWFDVVKQWFDSANLDAGAENAAQALEIIQSNIVLQNTIVNDGCPWLQANALGM
jgi:glutamyl aminopeptidase